jgi:hypothetical protein
MTHKDNRSQYSSRRSNVIPSVPRENANAQETSTDSMGNGMNPTGHYTNIFEGKKRKGIYPKQPRSL